MNTNVGTKYGGGRPRTLRAMALVASLLMAVVGLIGLGLAAPASADTAPVCPADTADTKWELQGNVCVGTTTETSPSVADGVSWQCPEGYTSEDDPVTETSRCFKEVEKEVIGEACPAGKTFAEAGTTLMDPTTEITVTGCYQKAADGKWQLTGVEPTPEYGCPEGYEEIRNKCLAEADPIEVTTYVCPEGFSSSDDPITSETLCTRESTIEETATCPVAGDVLTNLGDEEVANWQCVTPAAPVTPVSTGGAAVFTASATASGSQDICLVDGVTTVAIAYDVTGTGSGPTTGDAEYSANVATVDAVNAAIAAQTPAGATLGACGAPVTEVPVVVNPVAPATVPTAEPVAVAVPAAATVPTAVAAGGGSQAPTTPIWALALAIAGVLGAVGAGGRLVTTRK